jgi:hypothetical protein
MERGMKAFYVSDCEIWAGETADEARADYIKETGEQPDEEEFRELTTEELDSPFPDRDENEALTGKMTTIREQLRDHKEPGLVATVGII